METIKLLDSEGVQENDFYWLFQLTLRDNWNNEVLNSVYASPARGCRSENKTNSGGTPTTTFLKGSGIDTITARVVPTIIYCYDSTTAAPHRVLEAPVAIGSVPERQQYSVYPNPAQQQLSISSPAPIHTITISSPLGQQWLAYTGSGSTEVQLSIAHLPPGLYIVRVNSGYSTKMIKE